MLLKQEVLRRIGNGEISLVFRRWSRPFVHTGGTLRTSIGVLQFGRVDAIEPKRISDRDSRKAGYASLADLLEELQRYPQGILYRIELKVAGPDPRIPLRQERKLSQSTIAQLRAKLSRLDAASADGPWTGKVLRAIGANPGLRAADLAGSLKRDKERLKRDVRKLKELGLTESLQPGYRLAPRGKSLLRHLEQ